jgi:hypothetical protein
MEGATLSIYCIQLNHYGGYTVNWTTGEPHFNFRQGQSLFPCLQRPDRDAPLSSIGLRPRK